jgi:hypothetical protein
MIRGLIPFSGYSQEVLKYYFTPNLIFKNSGDEYLNLYCFISRIQPWDDENTPPIPTDNDFYMKSVYKSIIAMKKINSNDISAVIERVDWKSGIVYSQYSSTSNLNDVDEGGLLLNDFYVRNSYDQVFKCVSNGTTSANTTGIISSIEPLIDFSTSFQDNVIITGDGYKWKYIYTIDSGAKLKFFDENWMPLPINTHRSKIGNNSYGAGEISVINVFNSGNNYVNDNGFGVTTTINIIGDGENASAKAIISGGKITNVLMANTGSNYTYATATIAPNIGYTGNGAILVAEPSPIGGHGFDLLEEFGCRTIMVTAEFNGTETGTLPNDIDFRQIGLVANPEIKVGSSSQFANSSIYKATHDITVSQGVNNYIQDEFVYQGKSLEEATFSGRVLNFDLTNNILYLINTQGNITLQDILNGSDSNTLRIALQEVIEQIVPFSGNIIYIENRTKVTRTSTGLEQFRLTLNY